MFWMGFEPMIPTFERVKTIHALDRAATVISLFYQVVTSDEVSRQNSTRIRCLLILATHPAYRCLLDVTILVIPEDVYKSKVLVM
jgi:hypothetical protein